MLYKDLQKKIMECKTNNIIQFTLLENRSICLNKQLIRIENEDMLIISRKPVEYYIPLERIISCNIFEYKLYDLSLNSTLEILLYYDAIKKCYILGYGRKLIAYHGSAEGLAFFDHIKFRKMSLEKGVFLYCDWDYFDKTSEWIESIGVSIPLFGVTLGWKKNLYKYVEKKC